MTNEEAIKWLKDIHHRFNPTGEKLENEGGDVHLQALDMAIEALKERNSSDSLLTEDDEACKEQKSKLDLISRQDVYCILEKMMVDRPLDSDRWVIRDIDKAIKSLPSAEPKTGKNTNANEIYNYLKDRIGDIVDDMKEFDAWFERMVWHVKECDRLAKLTADCGADMRKGGAE